MCSGPPGTWSLARVTRCLKTSRGSGFPETQMAAELRKHPIFFHPALKHVPKHPLATTGWAAFFHGKFYLALIR